MTMLLQLDKCCPLSDNCAGAPCSDICVNDNVATAGYTCHCREQYKMDADKSTCIGGYVGFSLYYTIFALE